MVQLYLNDKPQLLEREIVSKGVNDMDYLDTIKGCSWMGGNGGNRRKHMRIAGVCHVRKAAAGVS